MAKKLRSLLQAFNGARDLTRYLETQFPLLIDEIPASREPEFGVLIPNVTDAHRLESELLSHPNFRQRGETRPHDGLLITLPEDTPTHLMASLELEKRRRFNFFAAHSALQRFDVSFKTAGKTTARREWEAAASCLTSGNSAAIKKVSKDFPDVSTVDPEAYNVLGACGAARSTKDIEYILADGSAVLTLETNTDACALATPDLEVLLGYRIEYEPEVIQIRFRDGYIDENRITTVLDRGLKEVKDIIQKTSLKHRLSFATESKASDTVSRVASYYNFQTGKNGRDIAIARNIVAANFYSMVRPLKALDASVPTSLKIAHGTANTKYPEIRRKSRNGEPYLALLAA